MKNQWTNFYTGYVIVKANGKGTERLINALLKKGIPIWDVKRAGTDSLVFCIDLKEVPKLRETVRSSDCKVTFISGKGGPFLLRRLLKNSGFLAGSLAFLVCLFVLSNMVWGIEIHNANPETEYAIRKELDKMGVKIGKVQFLLDDVDTIQRKLSDNVSALTWIGVELKGTTYHFQVVEKKQPKAEKKLSPQNLVAKKKATIADMFVEKGQPMIKVNDNVYKGQLLVSGIIGKEDTPKVVSARGVILGETWYNSTIEVPLKSNFSVFNGDEMTKHFLSIGNFSLPIWGFKDPGYKHFEKDTTVRPFHFLKWELPIGYKTETKRSKEDIVREYTPAQAHKEAAKMGRADLKKQLPADAEIKKEKILHTTNQNGKVKLIILYQVIENIAAGQPIIQGD
ncbi:sporulation protein YqfD [Peribacillus glennii]|uniref:Sporulation protein YqfD n=1 Tax=Peribacillus glennii TaxID=2303991 RepID=A0A372LIE8_9BACI|nr:sporulation protein YqfD [Peribacillus glennii]RFU65752.1 sporulation protein YqfD [Peribacillus glennii]